LHDPPSEAQRCQLKEKRIGCPPRQDPLEAESAVPARASPEIVGADVFTGERVPTTGSVPADIADARPATFVAVTRTRSTRPTSRPSGV
jgi:hypothetical protein